MRLRARSRLETEAELRIAIEAEAFEVHYQPVMELATNRIVGFEALVRWRHPERGLVAPLEFIPVAEATGLIVPLGRLVLDRACRDLQAWRDAAPGREHLTMSVNVSARQTVEPGFSAEVRDTLAASDLDASSLVLEITESIVLAEAGATTSTLRELLAMGVRIAIDDFGTGYSALEYFKRFSVQELKIDRSFVAELGRSQADTAIVTATLAFASALGLSVTAEGVEHADQVDQLRALGCQRAQGFFFARPMPASDVPGVLAANGIFAAEHPSAA
jgi:EAL domain-containing protein (putative c-di-GMP-specific phosphodiesterase class I)